MHFRYVSILPKSISRNPDILLKVTSSISAAGVADNSSAVMRVDASTGRALSLKSIIYHMSLRLFLPVLLRTSPS